MSEPGFPDGPKPKWADLWGIDPTYGDTTEAAEQKRLIEVATRLGYELGRKEAGEEIATKIESALMGLLTGLEARSAAAAIARVVTSQPSGGPSEPLTAHTGHSDLPEDAEAVKRPHRRNAHGAA